MFATSVAIWSSERRAAVGFAPARKRTNTASGLLGRSPNPRSLVGDELLGEHGAGPDLEVQGFAGADGGQGRGSDDDELRGLGHAVVERDGVADVLVQLGERGRAEHDLVGCVERVAREHRRCDRGVGGCAEHGDVLAVDAEVVEGHAGPGGDVGVVVEELSRSAAAGCRRGRRSFPTARSSSSIRTGPDARRAC